MPSITVIVPVLGRPQNAGPVADSFHANQTIDGTLIFVCTPGDTAEIAACWETDAVVIEHDEPVGPGNYAKKIQAGYRYSDDEYLLLGADDLRFHKGWDVAVLEIAEEFDVGVVGTNDLGNGAVIAGRHSTHPLVARGYIETLGGAYDEPGQVYHEGYSHNYVDLELVELAKHRGCYAHCHESVVAHHHPFWGKAKMDATYRRGQQDARADRVLFEQRRKLWLTERVAA